MGAEVLAEPKFRQLETGIRKTAEFLIDFTGKRGSEVEIYLVGNSKLKKNVLAYPSPPGFPRPDKNGRFLGEIYLNPDYIAGEKSKTDDKLAYMLIHGFLHLLGYDHKNKRDRIRMEKKEAVLLSKITNF